MSIYRILFFKLAACGGEYSLFSGSCNRRFGGELLSQKHSSFGVSPGKNATFLYLKKNQNASRLSEHPHNYGYTAIGCIGFSVVLG